eukprot:164819-Hanusia_phi.AAC.1
MVQMVGMPCTSSGPGKRPDLNGPPGPRAPGSATAGPGDCDPGSSGRGHPHPPIVRDYPHLLLVAINHPFHGASSC